MTEMQVAQPDEAALQRRRAGYDPEQVRLIKATVAQGATDAELAMFLELAARYGLDPFAHEIWCAPQQRQDGSRGRMLIMVGRDGLRKVARRLKARVDRDVVRENDKFEVERLPDGRRAITHSYNGSQKTRGGIVGAWCEVDGGPENYGFFYAPLEEYLPTSEAKLRYSPWGSQRSVMIMAAAERTALTMATNLSGVVVEGEMDLNEERAMGEGAGAVQPAYPSQQARELLEPLFASINALAPHTYGPGAVDLLVREQDEQSILRLGARLEEERAALAASADGEAAVEVSAADAVDEPQAPSDDASGASEAPPPDAEVVEEPAPAPAQEAPQEERRSPLAALLEQQEAERAAPGHQGELRVPPPTPAQEPPPPPDLESDDGPPLEVPDPSAPDDLPPLEQSAASVPEANLEEMRADLAYWLDVKADPEYLEQQGLSIDEVDSNIAELKSAIEEREGQG